MISAFKFSQINRLQSKFTVVKSSHAKILHRLFRVATKIRAFEGAQSRRKAAADSAVCEMGSRNGYA